jgi:5'-nucleotidase
VTARRILVTNDDGIDAPGLSALAGELARAGHELLVAAPDGEASGSSAAIGALTWTPHQHRIDVRRVVLEGIGDAPAYAVTGPPGLIVLAARMGGFGAVPDLVVSGINPGINGGRAVLHSGTVGAALTGANLGISGLAVSMSADAGRQHWETAAVLAARIVPWLLEQPAGTVLNLNVANRPLDRLVGVRWAELAPFGHVQTAIGSDPLDHVQLELTLYGENLPADSDVALVEAGWATVTLLDGITARPPVDGVLESLAGRG